MEERERICRRLPVNEVSSALSAELMKKIKYNPIKLRY